jgi:polysaccharide biosynthesis protein PslH
VKILTLVDRYPYPLSNGQNLRVFHYARRLSARHTLELVCYGENPVPEPLRELFDHIHVCLPPNRKPSTNRLVRIRDALSLNQLVPVSDSARSQVAQILKTGHFDALWVHGTNMMLLLPEPAPVPILLDDCDHSLIRQLRTLRTERNPIRWLRIAKHTFMLYLVERRVHPRAQSALYVSELDAAMFRRVCPQTSVHVIQNGVDIDDFQPSGADSNPFEVVFEGNMSFAPNVDAVLYFHDHILPLIRQHLPQVRFLIVGKDPAPEISRLASSSVEVTGFVEDVRPYLDRASLFVCPMRLGAGIKNKILQAWAMEKAVVATTASMGGLTGVDGENVLIADDPVTFADSTVTLLKNPERRQQLGIQGRRTVEAHYTWEQQSRRLEALLFDVADGTRVAKTCE